ncbi:MAG TPA: diguanylate cyclase, partial [Solirubrobacteraceae bacterium]
TADADSWSPDVEAAARETRERHHHALAGRERLVGAPFGLALLIAVGAVALLLDDARPFEIGPALAFVVAFAVAARVEFQTGAGYAVPTQLVFVPMLFALPAPAVPLVVGAGYVLARATEPSRPPLGLERVVGEFANAWYTLAPVLVIVLAGAEQPTIDDWPIYAAALGAQLALDALTAALRAWVAFGTHPLEMLRELRFAHRLDVVLAPLGMLAALAAHDAPFAWLLVLPLVGLISIFGRERAVLIDNQLELARAYRGTALLLGEVVEGDDEYTGRHSKSVALLALDVADHLGLDDSGRRDVEFAALLHDVGKVVMPTEIINKPGPLSPNEWTIMRTHTVEGQRMLDRVGGVLMSVGTIVRASHESWDGSGYPDGLRGEEIPLAARIISCCDAFNAMTTDRPYRPSRPLAEAIEELQKCAGTQFDPAVVEALIEIVGGAVDEVESAPAGVSERTLDRLSAELARSQPLVRRGGEGGRGGGSFRSLIEALDDGIVVHEEGGRVRACNPSAERMLGLRGGELEDALGPGGALTIVDEDGRRLGPESFPWHVAMATHAPCAPMTLGFEHPDGDVVWALVSAQPLRRRRSGPRAVVTSFSDVTEARRVESELRELVDQDSLTGFANRRRFEEDLTRQIERCKRYDERAMLLILDLDDFKIVNDTYGHVAGDAVLREVAAALRGCLRTSDVLGRLGGDEFAAILPHATPAETHEIAEKVRAAMSAATVAVGATTVVIGASIGVAAIDGRGAASDVIEAADSAMYAAKRARGTPGRAVA